MDYSGLLERDEYYRLLDSVWAPRQIDIRGLLFAANNPLLDDFDEMVDEAVKQEIITEDLAPEVNREELIAKLAPPMAYFTMGRRRRVHVGHVVKVAPLAVMIRLRNGKVISRKPIRDRVKIYGPGVILKPPKRQRGTNGK